MSYARLFLRGWIQVTLVALNVATIAKGAYALSVFTGGLISLVWYLNVGAGARDQRLLAAFAYSAGAAAGTATGMMIGRLIG